LNFPVLAFALAVACFTQMIFGLVPPCEPRATISSGPLRDSGKGTSSGTVGQAASGDAVIVCEVALSFTAARRRWIVDAQLRRFAWRQPWIARRSRLVTRLPLPGERYQTAAQLAPFIARCLRDCNRFPV